MPRNNNAGADPRQANIMARNMVVGGAVKRTQQIYSKSVDVASENVLNIVPRNVGLVLGFIVTVRAEFAVEDVTGTALTLTPFGPANLLKQVRLDDFNNNTRIQTSGWHLHSVNSARAGSPYLAARQNLSYPIDYGNHFPSLMQGAAAIAQNNSAVAQATYFVPCAYSEQDLRGAIYANVVNATMNLQLTLNNQSVQARTVSGTTDAVYVTANDSTPPVDAAPGNFLVEVYQVYYDQLPQGQNGVILPLLDLATVYEFKNTAVQGITANQDFPLPYSNFRDFLSTFMLYRNRASVSGGNGWALESDINYLALESANFTNLYKVPPRLGAAWGRQTIGDDFPMGLYYLPTRAKPISTVQYGNMALILNANNVQTNASVLIGYEAFAQIGRAHV